MPSPANSQTLASQGLISLTSLQTLYWSVTGDHTTTLYDTSSEILCDSQPLLHLKVELNQPQNSATSGLEAVVYC